MTVKVGWALTHSQCWHIVEASWHPIVGLHDPTLIWPWPSLSTTLNVRVFWKGEFEEERLFFQFSRVESWTRSINVTSDLFCPIWFLMLLTTKLMCFTTSDDVVGTQASWINYSASLSIDKLLEIQFLDSTVNSLGLNCLDYWDHCSRRTTDPFTRKNREDEYAPTCHISSVDPRGSRAWVDGEAMWRPVWR